MAKKWGISFDGFDKMVSQLDKLGGNVDKAVDEALVQSHGYMTPKLHADMARHERTGRTESAILDSATPQHNGTRTSLDVGFDLRKGAGGRASIFLMYGTPRMAKDARLYADVYGTKMRKEIAEIQNEVFRKAVEEAMNGG